MLNGLNYKPKAASRDRHASPATQILKLNLEMKYRSVLCASQLQPTLRYVTFSDLTYLKNENEKI